ncbi:MAG: serine hydrolase domain-containing protein [Candidatus Kariarchaeaceae archaeon]|jgi:CubicO group peptidase (beta-lactamase class C family)
MKITKSITVTFLFACIFSSCVTDPEIKLKFEEYVPEQLNDGWEISTPQAEGFDPSRIDRIYADLFSEDLYPTARSMLIIRNGKLVAEAYCKDKADRERFHAMQSATKSITSMTMGIAVDKGLVDSLNIAVFNYIPEYFDNDNRKRDITIYHTLTMQTGLAFVNDDHTNELFNYSGNSLDYVLQKNLRFLPGSSFYYNDGDPQLISAIIQKVSGMTMEQFADENLFHPLGINNYQWENHSDGITFGAFGLWQTPRDMAKIGKLMVQNGTWNNEQIISTAWIEESIRIHANTNYGYYWWNYEGGTTFFAEGRGEQLIYVNQEKNIAVVLTTDSFSNEILSPGIRSLIFLAVDAIIE